MIPGLMPAPLSSRRMLTMILLRKDINFAGYALPPAEMAPVSIDTEEVRRVLGEDAAHEKGVYGFRLIGAETPPLPSE
jgi:hypothetical protein